MLTVLVYVYVKEDAVDAFREASLKNATCSIQEPGISRFDVIQQADDARRFVLIESYRDIEAAAAHKETAHYAEWRDRVVDMMEEPRYSVKYTDCAE